MAEESLAELRAAFRAWRKRKKHAREAAPAELIDRARAAKRRFGAAAVFHATGMQASRLTKRRRGRGGDSGSVARTPRFSRVALAAPSLPTESGRAFAEVQLPAGVTVRLLAPTKEAVALLSSLLGAAGRS